MKKRTELQKKACKRNFTIMTLRGIYTRLGQLQKDHPKIKLYCGDMKLIIDKCLDQLDAETQSQRLKKGG